MSDIPGILILPAFAIQPGRRMFHVFGFLPRNRSGVGPHASAQRFGAGLPQGYLERLPRYSFGNFAGNELPPDLKGRLRFFCGFWILDSGL